MRNIINIASKVLTAVIIIFAVVLTGILLIKSDGDMARNYSRAFQEIGITLNILTIGTYVVTGLTVALIIVFSVSNMIIKPKAAVNALIGIAALAVIIIISFILSTPEIDPLFVMKLATNANVEVTDSLSKQVGAGLIATYILGALSILAIMYAWISKLIKG